MSTNKIQVAIFDFCGTFVPFQSADEYIRFSTNGFVGENEIQKSKRIINILSNLKIIDIFNKFFHYSINKRLIAKRIRGMKYSDADLFADSFFEKRIKPSLNKDVIDIFLKCKKQKMYVLLVSAAYDIYLNKFANYFEFDGVVSTKLGVKKNKMTGRIKNECIGNKKKKKAIKYLNCVLGKGNYNIAISVGDSKTDKPILSIAKKKIVISKIHQKWVKNNYEEIFYND